MNKLRMVITRTLWKYGLNYNSLYTYIYEDGKRVYSYRSPNYVFINMPQKEYEWYLDYIRNPIQRSEYDAPSDRYEIEIEKYDTETGEIGVKYNSDKY